MGIFDFSFSSNVLLQHLKNAYCIFISTVRLDRKKTLSNGELPTSRYPWKMLVKSCNFKRGCRLYLLMLIKLITSILHDFDISFNWLFFRLAFLNRYFYKQKLRKFPLLRTLINTEMDNAQTILQPKNTSKQERIVYWEKKCFLRKACC